MSLSILLVEVVHPSRGLFRQTLDVLEQLGVLLMDEIGEVATVVEDHVKGLTVLKPIDGLLNAPIINNVSTNLHSGSQGCDGT